MDKFIHIGTNFSCTVAVGMVHFGKFQSLQGRARSFAYCLFDALIALSAARFSCFSAVA
jgi:hypothetical protein